MDKKLKNTAAVWQMIFFVMFVFFIMGAFYPVKAFCSCADTCLNTENDWAADRINKALAEAEDIEKIKLLIQRGGMYQRAGHYDAAMADFILARNNAGDQNSQLLILTADQAIGNLLFLQGEYARAEKKLRSVLTRSRSLDKPMLTASAAHALAKVLSAMERGEEAYLFFQEAFEYAEQHKDPVMAAGILRNLAHILTDNARALEKLNSAWAIVQQAEPSREKMDVLLGIGAEAEQRKTQAAARLSFDAFHQALTLARDQSDIRGQAQALGGLAELYESLGQLNEAEKVNEQALVKAQALQAHDLLMDREWQMGRLLKAKNDPDRAVQAYRRAVYHIEALCQHVSLNSRTGFFFFHKKSLLIHQGLADLLLTLASRESKENVRQDLLREAQKVVEGIKLSKLRDYFRDPCLAALSKGIENLDPKTAVFYPIMLGDRLELLVEVNGELTCTTSFIQRDSLENEILQLARCLRRGLPFKERSQRVYDWLIKPVTPVLRSHNVDTLVIVPDGVLRLIPVGALMDGAHFLIEKYALVTVPGLTLLDPAPLGRYQNRTLLAGVSDPGPVIFDLPRHYWNALRIRGSDARGGDKGKSAVRGLSLETIDACQLKDSMQPENEFQDDSQEDSAEQKKGSTYDADLVRQALKLPGVKAEIESLSRRMTGKVLFNKAFELEPFCSELQAGTYNILHIASHGFFGGEPEKNFIMTFDKRLDMNRLEILIRPRQLADRPVEIVSLSACQTAEGDDRSPLGLTGVVLKSGARSALGSLWPVSDQAAQKLFPAFYALLGNSEDRNISKAEALRQAQLALMKQEGFHHPFYWSAFILVGNWL